MENDLSFLIYNIINGELLGFYVTSEDPKMPFTKSNCSSRTAAVIEEGSVIEEG